MSAAHTPGPWNADGGYGHHGLALTGPNGEGLGHVRALIPSGAMKHGMDVWMKWAEGQANAHLIAAAPDLLAALIGLEREGWFRHIEAACQRESSDTSLYAAVTEARAAIAKATGEQP